ncbi:hypothetical protein FBFR_16090 [Flavobacterium fryxellicola]|uniref:Uncharacterized protein n=2 Tax=Flavobacterium fryxellicola TaxID=249352 RepID=A0A167U2M4_9FLAO|nr:hypothetical protein FBFR_16090 [Flavobacterium fryxellicola]
MYICSYREIEQQLILRQSNGASEVKLIRNSYDSQYEEGFLKIPKNSFKLMVKNTLEDYKAAIQLKYEIEKMGRHSSFLLNPSRAKLRKLCAELFKNDVNVDDLKNFSAFFQFDFVPNCSTKLKDQTDRFRPIETFFKGETDLTDIEAVNIAAILVSFNPRPYLKFSKTESLKKEFSLIGSPKSTVVHQVTVEDKMAINDNMENNGIIQPSFLVKKRMRFLQTQQIIPAMLLILILGGFAYWFLPKKTCMQWQKDHYEVVVCETEEVGIVNLYSKLPVNESMLNFKKIEVSDTTTFFKHNKPILWYCKNGNHLDFFNGPGFHPENEKTLKPITQYMIDKYVK